VAKGLSAYTDEQGNELMALFGGKSKVPKKGKKAAAVNFSRVQVFSKAEALNSLLKGLKDQKVKSNVSRLKLKAASLVSGRGTASVITYQILNFKAGPRPALLVGRPKAVSGGNFIPADNPLELGEKIEVSYEMSLAQAGGNNVYFTAACTFLQEAIFIPNAETGKPWIGSRDATVKKMGEGGLKQGEEVLQLRIDKLTCFPNAPESFDFGQIESYVFKPTLYCLTGGGMWAKKVADYFEGIQDDIHKHLEDMEKKEQLKTIENVQLIEFGVDNISLFTPGKLLSGIEHDKLMPSMFKKPNDNLIVLNSCVGFLLKFEIADEIKELLMRTFAQKAGKEFEVWLPLSLGNIQEAEAPKERVAFQIFPRDLVQETDPRKRSKSLGLKFMPPFTLHPNAEDHNTYRKLMVAIGQRLKDDSRPEEEKNKIASVQAAVAQRQQETKGKRVDENMRKAFQKRVEAKKRKETAD
jgi:hypothetical protein